MEAGAGLLGYWSDAYGVTWYDARTQKLNLVQPGLVAAVEYIAGLYKLAGPGNIAEYRKSTPPGTAPTPACPRA